jgi:hypothetical protein
MEKKEKLLKVENALKFWAEENQKLQEAININQRELDWNQKTVDELLKLKEDVLNNTDKSDMMFFRDGITTKFSTINNS